METMSNNGITEKVNTDGVKKTAAGLYEETLVLDGVEYISYDEIGKRFQLAPSAVKTRASLRGIRGSLRIGRRAYFSPTDVRGMFTPLSLWLKDHPKE